MLTRDDIRAAALALPEAYEAAHFDIPSFRVGKKIFCTIHLDQPRIVLKLDPEDQHNLVDGAAVRPVDNSLAGKGWTYVYSSSCSRSACLGSCGWPGPPWPPSGS